MGAADSINNTTTDGITAEERLKINFQGFLRKQRIKSRQGKDALTGTSIRIQFKSQFNVTQYTFWSVEIMTKWIP